MSDKPKIIKKRLLAVQNIFSFFFLVFMVLSSLLNFAQAQTSPGPEVLTLNPAIRSYSMGNSGTADWSDPANAYLNPAAISFVETYSFMGSYGKLVPDLASDVQILHLGVAGKIMSFDRHDWKHLLAGSIRYSYLSYGEWEATSETGESLGTASSYEHSASLTAAFGSIYREMFYLGVGISAKPVYVRLAPEWATVDDNVGSGHSIAFDIGTVLKADLFREYDVLVSPSFGISYLNFGPSVTYTNRDQSQALPKDLRIGIGIRLESPSFELIDEIFERRVPFLTFAYNKDTISEKVEYYERKDIKGSGYEFGFFEVLYLRWGSIDDKDGNIIDDTKGYGISLFYKSVRVRFDYADIPQVKELDRVDKYGFSLDYSF